MRLQHKFIHELLGHTTIAITLDTYSQARLRMDSRYEARAAVDTPAGRKRVSFYGATAKEANEKKKAPTPAKSNQRLLVDGGATDIVPSTAWRLVKGLSSVRGS